MILITCSCAGREVHIKLWRVFLCSLVHELLSVLDGVQDVQFVACVCTEAIPPDLPTTVTLLQYAKDRLAASTQVLRPPYLRTTVTLLQYV